MKRFSTKDLSGLLLGRTGKAQISELKNKTPQSERTSQLEGITKESISGEKESMV
jgi:hypothetical protein